MIEISLQSKMWANPKKGFADMHENGNLKDKIGIQVGQIKRTVIEKRKKERRVNQDPESRKERKQ
jgi:hypothetical protein